MTSQNFFIILLISFTLNTNAQIITDGTLGSSVKLSGPDYLVGADLGQQHGGNLFHSFQDFNLQSYETATFSGPNSVNNIISRVTGGNPSHIDGTIRSLIPNANMYFLNPYGIVFGANAKLDVQGSFHASTADYLRLQDGGQFHAREPNNSLLTVAPIEAFGFLTNTPAPITTQDSQLSVVEGETLSLIGGNLRLTGQSPIQFSETGIVAIFAKSKLLAEAGQINLASVASVGEVILPKSALKLNAEGGQIILDKTLVDTSGKGSGAIFIRAGQLMMQDAITQANTYASQDGKDIDMKLTESVNINGKGLSVESISTNSGNAGNIVIKTPRLKIVGGWIDASNFGEGNAGNIDVEVNQAQLTEGAAIGSYSYGTGQGGFINLKVGKLISISGQSKGTIIHNGLAYTDYPTLLGTTTFFTGKGGSITIATDHLDLAGSFITTASLGKGDSGNLTIKANTVSITDGGFLATNGLATGKAGNIEIIVNDTLLLTGKSANFYVTPTGEEFKNIQSGIFSVAFAESRAGGNISISVPTLRIDNEAIISASTLGITETSGNITIDTQNLYLTQGGQINNSNGAVFGTNFFSGPGQGGTIQIKAKNLTITNQGKNAAPTGIFSDTFTSGQGGNIEIQTDHLNLSHDGAISAYSLSNGNAGQIMVQADTIKLTYQGEISTEAEQATGGDITVITPNLLYLQNGKITTSVGTGTGQGGDITVETPKFVVLNQSQMKAQADEGQGGNIRIVSEQFIHSADSIVSASSKLGLDGKIEIDSPDINIGEFLLMLPGYFFDASEQLQSSCLTTQHRNYFVVKYFTGSPPFPSDWKAIRIILLPK